MRFNYIASKSAICFCKLDLFDTVAYKVEDLDYPSTVYIISLVLMMPLCIMFRCECVSSYKQSFTRHTQASVPTAMHELDRKSKKIIRMRDHSFWNIHEVLKGDLCNHVACSRRSRKKKKRKLFAPNGLTHSSLRLNEALRIFACDFWIDADLVRGISHTEVYFSARRVMDTACNNHNFNIDFPISHAAHKEITHKFKEISATEFNNCCGCLDGFLT